MCCENKLHKIIQIGRLEGDFDQLLGHFIDLSGLMSKNIMVLSFLTRVLSLLSLPL